MGLIWPSVTSTESMENLWTNLNKLINDMHVCCQNIVAYQYHLHLVLPNVFDLWPNLRRGRPLRHPSPRGSTWTNYALGCGFSGRISVSFCISKSKTAKQVISKLSKLNSTWSWRSSRRCWAARNAPRRSLQPPRCRTCACLQVQRVVCSNLEIETSSLETQHTLKTKLENAFVGQLNWI